MRIGVLAKVVRTTSRLLVLAGVMLLAFGAAVGVLAAALLALSVLLGRLLVSVAPDIPLVAGVGLSLGAIVGAFVCFGALARVLVQHPETPLGYGEDDEDEREEDDEDDQQEGDEDEYWRAEDEDRWERESGRGESGPAGGQLRRDEAFPPPDDPRQRRRMRGERERRLRQWRRNRGR